MSELTVATFNAFFGQGLRIDGMFDVGAVIAELDADVVGIQETWTKDGTVGWAREAADALGYEIHEQSLCRAVWGEDRPDTVVEGGEGDWGIALLSRLPLRDMRVLELGQAAMDRSPRFALRAEVDVDGTPLTFVTTHLSHRPWGTVAQQWRLRRQLIRERKGARRADPIVVVGDFNMWGPVVDVCMGRTFGRTVKGKTWPTPRPHSQLDHVLVGPGVELVEGRILGETPSDHLPMWARLRIGDGPAPGSPRG